LKTEILGVLFDVCDKKSALETLISYLDSNENHLLITPNPEIVLEANNDGELLHIINKADLVIPDGIGIVWASKLNKIKLKERVAGYDLIQSLLRGGKDKNYTAYFWGGAEGVAYKAAQKTREKYEGVKISGTASGYFDEAREKEIVEEIKILKPNVVLLGLGYPKQEKLAHKYKNVFPSQITACVGGALDVMSGNKKRAPDIFIKFGAEWLYRIVKEKRAKRAARLPIFIVKVVKEKINARKRVSK
jgi:N-acetylglucosaminyldiphosphoundecaprenol N-acetyl-beta-D-mannosaminyltransferase